MRTSRLACGGPRISASVPHVYGTESCNCHVHGEHSGKKDGQIDQSLAAKASRTFSVIKRV